MKISTGMVSLAVVWLFLSMNARTVAADRTEPRPNIVFLLADDLGWTGLGCFGSDLYETPNLDRLAAKGTRFTGAYSACTVCSPTRASIMTGMYPARLQLTDFIAGQNRPWAKLRIPDWTKHLEHRYVTIAEALKPAGYTTAQVGKWHLAPRTGNPADYDPVDHGFDVQIPKPKEAKGYYLPKGFNAAGESKSDYVTDYLTDKAVEFIDNAKDDPFFLYFAYHTPHTPIQGRKDLVERFTKKVRPDALHKNPEYAAMVHSLDQSVGRILQRLERHEIADRTVVIFTSDNGGLTQRYGKHDGFTENLPLRRGKGSAYEGGVRVPAIAFWPGVTKPGTVCDEPVVTIDYYPTILQIAKASGDARHNESVDGVSLVTLLRDCTARLERDAVFWHYPHYHAGGDSPYSAVRSGDWRLIEFHEDDGIALYNLKDDPGESTNLAPEMPERTARLRDQLRAWRKRVNAQMPTKNPDHDPARAAKVAPASGVKRRPAAIEARCRKLFAKENLVAWCVVPFDASKRGPKERAEMLRRLGFTKLAYDWRAEHVPTFEEEIIELRRQGIEFFVFWSEHPEAFRLFEKHGIAPQVWRTPPSPANGTQEEKVEASAKALLPLVERTEQLGCKLGLYNHGGWAGEPDNLVDVTRWLREHAAADHVGIVYNFHHAHEQIHDFADVLANMQPYLLCLNLNGMNSGANPKILPIGQGQHERKMIKAVIASGYQGPIGILDHRSELDAEESLSENLAGLAKLVEELVDE